MTARDLWRRDPTQVLKRAVEGMLPKNNLQRDRMRKLRVFTGPDHPFGATPLVPWEMPPKQLEDHRLGWGMPAGFAAMNPAAYARRMLGARRVAGAVAAPAAAGGAGSEVSASEAAAAAALAGVQQRARQQQARQQQGQGQVQQQAQGPVIDFDDLLAADEREFIEQCKQRGGDGGRAGRR
jgi:hypothetical protein